MRLAINIGTLAVLAQIAVVYSAAVDDCGDLGIMKVSEGINPSHVRKCADHPLGKDKESYKAQWESLPPASDTDIEERGLGVGLGLEARAAQKPVELLAMDSGVGQQEVTDRERGWGARPIKIVTPAQRAGRDLIVRNVVAAAE
ncbi:hypothetical protein PQX77_006913 [Marasmius sp. AFHP31]|nr:hypothetical protein PQX77_006913 [Marasmius sp. AFHP31]